MSEWQTIDTAPKDGTRVLAFASAEGGREFYGVAMWFNPDPDLNPSTAPDKLPMWWWSYAIRPTHWMPLPPPPKVEERT